MWSMHTAGCYSVLKRKYILTPATTWMNPEDIMLSEVSQSQRTITESHQLQRQKVSVEGWVPGARGREMGVTV